MLVCRACNTRYENGREACPSCGRRSSRNATEAGESGPLPPSDRRDEDPGPIDLEEESVLPVAEAREPTPTPSPRATRPEAGSGGIALSPIQVKTLLAEQPGLLETGLGLHADEDGDPTGLDFATPVGSIDVLARDRKGGFVVVHVPETDEITDSVSAMLRRMGWVRKHLADDADVRGVVVIDRLPEDLLYAAAGAGGSICFKSCRLSLSFHELED